MKNLLIMTSCLAVFCVVPSMAVAEGNGLGVKASTLGAGIEYERQFKDNFGIRLGYNYFQFDSDFNVDDIDYESSVNLQSASLLLDWYPLASSFRLTGGIMYNGNDADFSATPSTPVIIGDTVYTPQMVGTLSGSVTFDTTAAPYAGFGWSSSNQISDGLSVAFDVGILFQGSPSIDNFQATGSLADNPVFQTNLDKEELKIEDDLDSYKYYPVVAFTLTYRF